MKKIHFSGHAAKRMTEHRQKGIVRQDVIRACHRTKDLKYLNMGDTLKLGEFTARSGRKFSIVISKQDYGLKIVTVIGGEWGRRTYEKRRTKEDGIRKYRERKRKKDRTVNGESSVIAMRPG